jgi:hypothetical protein
LAQARTAASELEECRRRRRHLLIRLCHGTIVSGPFGVKGSLLHDIAGSSSSSEARTAV